MTDSTNIVSLIKEWSEINAPVSEEGYSAELLDDLASKIYTKLAADNGDAVFSPDKSGSIIIENGSISGISTEDIAYNIGNKDGKFRSIHQTQAYDILHSSDVADAITNAVGEDALAKVYEKINVNIYKRIAETATEENIMVISSADGQDENWNTSVVKTLLNSENIKYINFLPIEEYRQMYKMDTEVFGYSEEEALQVVSECMALQNVGMLADSAVAADEKGGVLLDENGHAQIYFSHYDSSDEGVIRPFFRSEPDEELNAVFNDYFDSSEVSTNDINDMMTISDSGLFTNLLESSDKINKLNEELARFVVEYPDCVSSNNSSLQMVVANVNQNESTRALVERSVELTKQYHNGNSNVSGSVSAAEKGADFVKRYPTIASVVQATDKSEDSDKNSWEKFVDGYNEYGDKVETGLTAVEGVIEQSAAMRVGSSFELMARYGETFGYTSQESRQLGQAMEVMLPRFQKFAGAAEKCGKGLVAVSGAITIVKAVKKSCDGDMIGGVTDITHWTAGQLAFAGASTFALSAIPSAFGTTLALLAITNPIAAGAVVVGAIVIGLVAGKLAEAAHDWIVDKLFGASHARVPVDPLIIDMTSNGFNIEKRNHGTYFDLNCDGFAEKINWTSSDGILAIDLNHNGVIDDGSEVFGDYHEISEGKRAKNGFEALAHYDSNGDEVIDEEDEVFEELKVWVDRNSNGISESDELLSLKDAKIRKIDLNYTEANRSTDSEALIGNVSTIEWENGSTDEIGEMWVASDLFDAIENVVVSASAPIDGIPQVRSYGKVGSLNTAVANDETGILRGYVEEFQSESDNEERVRIVEKIVGFLCDTDSIEEGSRGPSFSAKKLAVIEKFMGEGFIGINGENPNSAAAPILENVYGQLIDMYFMAMLGSDVSKHTQLLYAEEVNGELKITTSVFNAYVYSMLSEGLMSENELADICTYISYFGKDILEDFVPFHSLRRYLEVKAPEYVDIMDNAVFGAIKGNDSDNTINGTNSKDIIYGNDGNDTIRSGNNDDLVFGGNGNDHIDGGYGNDHIYGGEGNDTLVGGEGDDTYYFTENHGNDKIIDASGDNKLIFSEGLSIEDYDMSVDASLGFVLTHNETGEIIGLQDFLTHPLNYDFIDDGESVINNIGGGNREIFNGTSEGDVIEGGDGFNIFYGGEGDDTLNGGKDMDFMYGGNGDDLLNGRNGVNVLFGEGGNDTIYDGDDGSYLSGGEGNDKLYGGGGADVLDGGKCNDYLQGDHGNDTYIFGRGYDSDVINASSDNNTVIIRNYTTSGMKLSRNGHNDLIMRFGNDSLTIDHFFDYNSNRDFNFVFEAEGKSFGQYEITQGRTVSFEPVVDNNDSNWLGIYVNDNVEYHGLGGADGIGAGNGNDILDGGSGNDTLMGGNGTDTYIFAKGYDHDTINEWSNEKSIIKFFDITSDEVEFVNNGGNLDIIVKGTDDVLTINGFQWGQGTYELQFADLITGTVDKETYELSATPASVKLKEATIAAAQEAIANGEEFTLDDTDWVNTAYMALDEGLECFGDETKIFDRTSLFMPEEITGTVDKTFVGQVPVREADTLEIAADDISAATDKQVLLLTENMSAFTSESQVADSIRLSDISAEASALDLLLTGSSVQ